MAKYVDAIKNTLSVYIGVKAIRINLTWFHNIAKVMRTQYVNQVFTGLVASRTLLSQKQTIVNALISPTDQVGKV